jgi:AAA family ATP:ADP antiporter
MLKRLFATRPGEGRDTWAAFAMLLSFIGSYSILETARDALFLAKVPASRLPWVYLAIAAISLLVARIQSRLARVVAGRRALSLWTAISAVVTLGFWWALRALGPAGLYGLYVWSGVLSSLVLVHFWTLLGDLFSVTQAKRLYGLIGAGSVAGAIAGSGAASALARTMPADRLLLIAACGLLATAALPMLFTRGGRRTEQAGGSATAEASLLENAAYIVRQPYARRVAWLMVVSTACLTVGDYLFKSTVAASIPRAQLGAYLASVYLVLNVLSLLSQLFLVGWMIRRFDLSAALAVLPVLLVLGGFGMVVGGALVAALAIKGADGALRYSLHRTSTELLFVPLGEEARRRTKAFIDVVGQRGGQSIASVGILVAAWLAAPPPVLAGVLVLLGAAWAAAAFDLRRHYVDIFRRHLREGRIEHVSEFPDLDVASLETLIAALDSRNDAEVLAALDVLEREKKAHLVPALILYHPSEPVVERALALFMRAGRKSIVHVADRLLEHESPRVRAAAIAARSVLQPDARLLNLQLSLEESPEVRATILMHLILSGELIGSEAKERLDALIGRGSPEAKAALAEAIAVREAKGFSHVLAALAEAPQRGVKLATIRAMARVRAPEFVEPLLRMLADEDTRTAARAALLQYGDDAFGALRKALEETSLDQTVRWEVPRVLALFEPERAAPILLGVLPTEADGMVRYRAIRALETLVARSPTLALDRAVLERAIEDTVSRAYRYLDRRLILLEGARADPRRGTPGHELLVKMLEDKEEHAVGRVFRLLGLAFPTEDFPRIYGGLKSSRAGARASSIELVENLVEPPLRGAVVGLIDDVPDAQRLAAGARYHEPTRLSYEALLERMLDSESEALQDITVYHVGELALMPFKERILALEDARRRAGAEAATSHGDVLRTLEILGASPSRAEAAPC